MQIKALSAALLGSAAALTAPAQAAQNWNFHFDHVLGTSLDIVAVAADESLAGFAAALVRAEITRLDAVLSGWRSDSELAALNTSSSFVASPDLFDVIAATEYWRKVSNGAFSARLGDLEGAPYNPELAGSIDAADVVLDSVTRRIVRPEPVRFAIDGLAKGYVVDRALEKAAQLPGLRGLMLDIGGDLRCWGEAPDGKAWRIGVTDACTLADNAVPPILLALNDKAVATSGKGMRTHTIFDPTTGLAASHTVMATAVADCAADADALASVFSVLTPKDSILLADSMPGVAARIVDDAGNTHVSSRWDGIVLAQNTPAKPAPKPVTANTTAWPAGYAVKIEYVLPPGRGGRRARNPYVAIYITNQAGDMIRTLTFQADRERYMHEVYVFWNKYRNQVDFDAVTKPTRWAGTYSIDWDGKDDQGRPVPRGKYTINVESAREHGFHSLQKIELDIGAAPVSGAAGPQEDMGDIKASYGPAQ